MQKLETAPVYFTVVIPFSARPTKWHPTEPTGPFSTLTRGYFLSPQGAEKWAEAHLNGQPYEVRFVDMRSE